SAAATIVKVRRWDSDHSAPDRDTLTMPASPSPPWVSSWAALENGINVQFRGASFQPGDYWVIAARAGAPALAWPLGDNQQPEPLAAVASDPRHAKLAKLYRTPAGTWQASPLPELRRTFTSLQNAVKSSGVLTWDDVSAASSGMFFANAGLTVGSTSAPQTL